MLRRIAMMELRKIKLNNGALYMQCALRKFLARHRAKRISMRRLYLSIHLACACVQSWMRLVLQRRAVKVLRAERAAIEATKAAAVAAAAQAELEAKNAAETKEFTVSRRPLNYISCGLFHSFVATA
jgi:branched-subunit amino acid ABC-type transport system permease component